MRPRALPSKEDTLDFMRYLMRRRKRQGSGGTREERKASKMLVEFREDVRSKRSSDEMTEYYFKELQKCYMGIDTETWVRAKNNLRKKKWDNDVVRELGSSPKEFWYRVAVSGAVARFLEAEQKELEKGNEDLERGWKSANVILEKVIDTNNKYKETWQICKQMEDALEARPKFGKLAVRINQK